MFYSFIKILFGNALRVYFKKVDIIGLENVPRDCPILITPNHQNAFLDAFIAGAFSPVPLHFLTRSDVFHWWSKPLFKLLNMMPIYRIRDGYEKLTENEAIFKTCEELFRQKKTVLIFAEGNHGEHHFLRPLTKGAARLALRSQMAIDDELKVVPVGINYFDHKAPGTKLILVFGKPISVSAHVDQYRQSSGIGLKAMRDAIALGMKSTLVIPDETSDYEQMKRTVFQKQNEHLSFDELRKIKSGQLTQNQPKSKHLIAKLLNPIPYFFIWKMLSGLNDVVFVSSIKFATGLITFPIWWLVVFLIFYWSFGIITATVTVLIMILSLILSYRWSR